MTVRTTYFGGIGQFDPDESAAVFGVVRYPKDFVERVTDRNIPAIAPPKNLLNAFKSVESAAKADDADYPSAVAWRSVDFERRYRNYLRTFPGPQHVLDELRDRATERDVWLVCWEKDCRWCHRRLLASEVVADLGVDVVHHPDPSTLDEPADPSDESEQARDAALTDFGAPEA